MGAILGVLVGLVLGLTDAGGSVLAVPVPMFGLGWAITQATPVALIAVCAAATFGTLVAWNASHVRYRPGTGQAATGSRCSSHVARS